jgi:hypothetical protein
MVRTLALLLVGGAIVNVAVAWGCATFVSPSDDSVAFAHHFYYPKHEPQWVVTAWEMPGALNIWTEALQFDSNTIARLQDRDFVRPPGIPPEWSRATLSAKNVIGTGQLTEIEAARGWPRISMLAVYTFYFGPQGWTKRGVRAGIDLSATDADPSNAMYWRALPLEPLWPGFAINTIFYAAILWVLFFAPGKLKRAIRRRRGLCPACAYPIGSSPVCTECGASLPFPSGEGPGEGT